MIQANELRIGNTIQYQSKPVKVGLQTLERLLYPELKKNAPFKNQYKPIPLTDDWLIRFGFEINPMAEEDAFEKFRHKEYQDFSLEDFNREYYVVNGIDQWHSNIYYVHQLQNLYYALTGQELTLQS